MRAAVGIDLGGTKVQGVVADDKGNLLGQARGKTPVKGGPGAVVEVVAEVTKASAKDAKLSSGKLDGVGIGTPGLVDGAGTVHGAANLPGFDEPVPLAGMVGQALDVARVVVDNDVNVSTVAEHRLGAGRGFDDLLVVFVGSGVGAGWCSAAASIRAPTAPPVRSATWWWSRAASCARAAGAAAWRPTPGGWRWSGRPGPPPRPAGPPSCSPSRSARAGPA
jgi:predicted NBD/HSP70 family sugar kinase